NNRRRSRAATLERIFETRFRCAFWRPRCRLQQHSQLMETRPIKNLSTCAKLDYSVYLLAALGVFVHFLFNSRYGYFRDELYYAACGEHLAWGYIDHAPLVALIARLSRSTLGDSLFALRFFPALAAAAKVYLSGWMARELSGGRFAQLLAALTTLVAPIYLTFDSFLSMNSFEPLFWMACAARVCEEVGVASRGARAPDIHAESALGNTA